MKKRIKAEEDIELREILEGVARTARVQFRIDEAAKGPGGPAWVEEGNYYSLDEAERSIQTLISHRVNEEVEAFAEQLYRRASAPDNQLDPYLSVAMIESELSKLKESGQ